MSIILEMNMNDPALHKDASISSPLKGVDEPWYPNVSASVFHLGTFFFFVPVLFVSLLFVLLCSDASWNSVWPIPCGADNILLYSVCQNEKKFAPLQIHHIFFFRPKTKRK